LQAIKIFLDFVVAGGLHERNDENAGKGSGFREHDYSSLR